MFKYRSQWQASVIVIQEYKTTPTHYSQVIVALFKNQNYWIWEGQKYQESVRSTGFFRSSMTLQLLRCKPGGISFEPKGPVHSQTEEEVPSDRQYIVEIFTQTRQLNHRLPRSFQREPQDVHYNPPGNLEISEVVFSWKSGHLLLRIAFSPKST